VPLVVSFASFLDETSSLSDLVLPTPTSLEEWGDDVPPAGHSGEAVALSQPVVEPFRDTRSMADVLLAAAKELGGGMYKALPWRSFRECLEEAYRGAGMPMEEALRNGGFFSGKPGPARPTPRTAKPSLPEIADAAFDGEEGAYPLVLHLYPSVSLYDGRGANLSWLQELPDPVSTAVWRNWVELNPQTARTLGLSDGDGVTVSSPSGTIEAHVAHHPGIAQGVAAMPLGQGHGRYGANAEGRGGNPFALLPAARGGDASGFPLQVTRVRLAKTALKSRLARTAHPEGQWKIGNVM
jgi:molybdopterin-containing oxidoreductase family iron-sulfur binding subunit